MGQVPYGTAWICTYYLAGTSPNCPQWPNLGALSPGQGLASLCPIPPPPLKTLTWPRQASTGTASCGPGQVSIPGPGQQIAALVPPPCPLHQPHHTPGTRKHSISEPYRSRGSVFKSRSRWFPLQEAICLHRYGHLPFHMPRTFAPP